jgi:hypothetical protein
MAAKGKGTKGTTHWLPTGGLETATGATYTAAQVQSAFATAGKVAGEGVKGLPKGIGTGVTGGGRGPVDPKAKKTSKGPTPTTEKAAEEAIANSPWTKESDALANQMASELAPIAAEVSGANAPQQTATTVNDALADISGAGGSVTGQTAQWLNQNLAAANTNAAPLRAAETALGKEFTASAAPMEQAIRTGGSQNAEAVSAAPYATLLKAIAGHTANTITYGGGQLPGGKGLPAWLRYYATQAGVDIPTKTASTALSKSLGGTSGTPTAGDVAPGTSKTYGQTG